MSRRLIVLPAAVLLALALSSPAVARSGGARIVNGTEAGATEFPAQGYLTVDMDPFPAEHCGGTLVGTRQFLTAASCVSNHADEPELLTVTLGDINIDPPNDDYSVVDVDVNVTYSTTTQRNDTAMLTLGRPAAAYEVMRVVDRRVVPGGETELWAPGVTATILGWGKTSSAGGTSNLLRTAQVPVRTDADCENVFHSFFDPTSMVCAGDGSSDACEGDEGGPLLVPDGPGFFGIPVKVCR